MSPERVVFKNFSLREETMKRCHVFKLTSANRDNFQVVSLELFHFLYEMEKINFCIYFRIGDAMIEFMRKEEFSKELLDQLWAALRKARDEIDVCVARAEYPIFETAISQVRKTKLNRLLERVPQLNHKILTVFDQLSGVSQMIVSGGINADAVSAVKASTEFLVANVVDSDEAISTLSKMISVDSTLYDHSACVAMLSTVISKQIKTKLNRHEIQTIAQSGLYHDVGKTCVPNSILNKPGAFSPEEYEVMKTHAEHGTVEIARAIANGANIDPLCQRVAGEHHEKYAGGGYPHGRCGSYENDNANGIHLATRIITISDVYSALLMRRVYKPPYDPVEALRIMQNMADHFDPVMFKQFVHAVVKSLNIFEEKNETGRILSFDAAGSLQHLAKKEKKKSA